MSPRETPSNQPASRSVNYATPATEKEEKLLRRTWRAERAIVRAWDRNEKRATTDLETYELCKRVLAYHVDKARERVREIEEILPDLRISSTISAPACAGGGVRKPKSKKC